MNSQVRLNQGAVEPNYIHFLPFSTYDCQLGGGQTSNGVNHFKNQRPQVEVETSISHLGDVSRSLSCLQRRASSRQLSAPCVPDKGCGNSFISAHHGEDLLYPRPCYPLRDYRGDERRTEWAKHSMSTAQGDCTGDSAEWFGRKEKSIGRLKGGNLINADPFVGMDKDLFPLERENLEERTNIETPWYTTNSVFSQESTHIDTLDLGYKH